MKNFRRKVLGLSRGIDDVGNLQWELAGSLLVVWILVYLCVRNGIKTSGKVVYFTGKKLVHSVVISLINTRLYVF